MLFFLLTVSSGISARQLFHRSINQWKNNKYEGLGISWYDTLGRQVERKGHYHDGNERGTWRYYYEDGTLRKLEKYSRRGISTKYFYPSGKLKSKGKAVMDIEEQYLHYYYQGDWIYSPSPNTSQLCCEVVHYGEDGKP